MGGVWRLSVGTRAWRAAWEQCRACPVGARAWLLGMRVGAGGIPGCGAAVRVWAWRLAVLGLLGSRLLRLAQCRQWQGVSLACDRRVAQGAPSVGLGGGAAGRGVRHFVLCGERGAWGAAGWGGAGAPGVRALGLAGW